MKLLLLFILFTLSALAHDLVEINNVKLDMRYATNNNFLGTVVTGYEAQKCYLHKDSAAALMAVEKELNSQNLHLVLFDCYRPKRAVAHFVRWAKDINDTKNKYNYYPHVEKSDLFNQGYIAYRSGHSRGNTVDLSILECDFGSPYDFFDESSHTLSENIDIDAQANRLYLKELMARHGFRGLKEEWWHFTYAKAKESKKYYDFIIR